MQVEDFKPTFSTLNFKETWDKLIRKLSPNDNPTSLFEDTAKVHLVHIQTENYGTEIII